MVLAIHRDQISTFGGTSGIRDEKALDSALAQPVATFQGDMLHRTIAEQAGAYLFHLVQNHPFLDGNKRVGFAAMDTFLRLNSYRLDMEDDEAYQMVMAVAAGDLAKVELSQLLAEKIALT